MKSVGHAFQKFICQLNWTSSLLALMHHKVDLSVAVTFLLSNVSGPVDLGLCKLISFDGWHCSC